MYVFKCEYGQIETIAIDMDELRRRVSKWQEVRLPPKPPLVPPEYYRENREEMYAIKNELKLTRKQAIEEWRSRQDKVENHKDKDYVSKKNAYERTQYFYMLQQVILLGVVFDGLSFEDHLVAGNKDVGIIPKIMADAKVAGELYQFIIGNSELSNHSVTREIEALEITWNEIPILQAIKILPKGKIGSNWKTTGLMAAKSMGVFSDFEKMTIIEQSKLIAIYLVDNWVKALGAKEARDNAQNNRSNKPIHGR